MEKSSLAYGRKIEGRFGETKRIRNGSGVLRWSRYWKSLWRAGVIVDIRRPLDIGTLLAR